MYGEPHGCELGYKTDGHGKPLEECLKPKSWTQACDIRPPEMFAEEREDA